MTTAAPTSFQRESIQRHIGLVAAAIINSDADPADESAVKQALSDCASPKICMWIYREYKNEVIAAANEFLVKRAQLDLWAEVAA